MIGTWGASTSSCELVLELAATIVTLSWALFSAHSAVGSTWFAGFLRVKRKTVSAAVTFAWTGLSTAEAILSAGLACFP